jgi:Zn-finger protein
MRTIQLETSPVALYDGGAFLLLFSILSLAMWYIRDTEPKEQRTIRLLSGRLNLVNSIVYAMLLASVLLPHLGICEFRPLDGFRGKLCLFCWYLYFYAITEYGGERLAQLTQKIHELQSENHAQTVHLAQITQNRDELLIENDKEIVRLRKELKRKEKELKSALLKEERFKQLQNQASGVKLALSKRLQALVLENRELKERVLDCWGLV